MKRIYLAGPMRGYEDYNFPAFNAAAAKLRSEGHFVFNPAEHDEVVKQNNNGAFDLGQALAADLTFICTEATSIALLPGWEKSRGACAEHAAALAMDREFIYL